MNEIPAYQKPIDWHFASMRYGDYVAFNGDSDFAMLVESILRQPKEYLKILEGTSVNLDIAYNKVAESFRESTNGHKYNWYARFNGYEEGEICKFMALVLNHGLIFTHIFNNLSEDSEFQGLSALESIPRIKEKLSIKLIQDNDSLIQKIQFAEVQEKSVTPQVNEIALEVIRQLEERDKLNVTQNDHQSIELNKLIDSQKLLIDTLESSLATVLSEKTELEKQLISSQTEVGKKTHQLMQKEDSSLSIFSSIFPQFQLLNKSNFFKAILIDEYLKHHINELSKFHFSIFKNKQNVEDIKGLQKIKNLSTWYALEINISEVHVGGMFRNIYDQSWAGGVKRSKFTPPNRFLISISTEYGNDKYYIHFGSNSEDTLELLEKHDPPRDNLERGI
jgi:hypothetical protein